MEIDTFSEKMMTIATGHLYSMNVILQGIGSHSCIMVYIIYVSPFGEQQPWMSEDPKLERFNQKNRSPEVINFYLYCINKKSFWRSPKGPPTTGVVELWKKKHALQWTPMEIGSVPEKNDEYFHWRPIFYECNSARNWVPFIRKGI